jgi:hypothetical protein
MGKSDVAHPTLAKGSGATVAGRCSRQMAGPADVIAGLGPEGDTVAPDEGGVDPGDTRARVNVSSDDKAEAMTPHAPFTASGPLDCEGLISCLIPSGSPFLVHHDGLRQSFCRVGVHRRRTHRTGEAGVTSRCRRSRTMLSLVFGAMFGAMAITSGPVHASQPVREPFDDVFSFEVDDLCDFAIMVDAHLEGANTFYVDGNDTLRRISVHVREQDTFSANGTVLVGLPFRFNQEILFDANGVVEHAFASGIVEWVPLPDGTTYHAAGRIDFVLHGTNYVIVPDWGTPVDVGRFCNAFQ